ncbi:MAG: DUF308 domain-containing protein [Cyanobacteria bacterium]|nr:DUF308 domain-containing protein [Cyanobacteriota bacterium]
MGPNPTLRWITAGLLLIAAGLAIILTFISATVLTLAIGGVAISAGIAQILRIGSAADGRSKVFRALAGVFYGVSGFWILLYPMASEVSLTLFAGLLLLFEGVMELAGAAASSSPAKGLVLVDGVVTAILGGMLVAEWPSDSLWAVGTLLGISLFFSVVNPLSSPKANEA